MRRRFLYRLVVEYPDGPPPIIDAGGDDWYGWPAVRCYQSLHAAGRRAELLRHYGCKVTVERSNPVTWGEQ